MDLQFSKLGIDECILDAEIFKINVLLGNFLDVV